MDGSCFLVAYLGPETMLPMTSVAAGALGVLMMFGRQATRWMRGLARVVVPAAGVRPAPSRPARRIGAGPIGRFARREASRVGAGD